VWISYGRFELECSSFLHNESDNRDKYLDLDPVEMSRSVFSRGYTTTTDFMIFANFLFSDSRH
jgi:hypothetical protein